MFKIWPHLLIDFCHSFSFGLKDKGDLDHWAVLMVYQNVGAWLSFQSTRNSSPPDFSELNQYKIGGCFSLQLLAPSHLDTDPDPFLSHTKRKSIFRKHLSLFTLHGPPSLTWKPLLSPGKQREWGPELKTRLGREWEGPRWGEALRSTFEKPKRYWHRALAKTASVFAPPLGQQAVTL